MHKLVILLNPPADEDLFNTQWATFLHHAEQMPRLRRETTSRVQQHLYGSHPASLIHELHFDNEPDLRAALASQYGLVAGQILQQITRGNMTLLLAEHHEDALHPPAGQDAGTP